MTLVSSERLHTGKVVNLDRDTVQFPNGSTGQLEMIRHPGASAVVRYRTEPTDTVRWPDRIISGPHTGLCWPRDIAVGVRKNNPQMLRAVNMWIQKYGPRTAFGNMMERRYLENVKYVNDAAAEKERAKLRQLVRFFEMYGNKYDVDYVLMAAQGYQESRLDQSVKSQVGAIGVMQVMPATGAELNVGDIMQLEPNIHAGVKYMRFMMDQYYRDEPMTDPNARHGHGIDRALKRRTCRIHGSTQWAKLALPV